MRRVQAAAFLIPALTLCACTTAVQGLGDGTVAADAGGMIMDAPAAHRDSLPPDGEDRIDAGVDSGVVDTGQEDSGIRPDGGVNADASYQIALVKDTTIEIHDLTAGHIGDVTADDYVSSIPRWSPAGTELAFSTGGSGTGPIEAELWNVASETRIGSFSASAPDWSGDGGFVAGIDLTGECIRIYTIADGTEQCLPEPGSFGVLRWDPSGTLRFAFMASDASNGIDQQLWVRDMAATRFAIDDHVRAHSWAPAGDRIAYLREVGGSPFDCDLLYANLDASSVVSSGTIMTGAVCNGIIAWSPAGDLIAYADFHGQGTGALRVVGASSTTAVARDDLMPIAVGTIYSIYVVDWTSDGAYVAFSTGGKMIYEVNVFTPAGIRFGRTASPLNTAGFSFQRRP